MSLVHSRQQEAEQWCTFRLAGLYFGVPALAVREMIQTTARTRVPLVSPVVHGLVNLRGEIVTTIDLRRRLGFPPALDRPTLTNVVISLDDVVVSLVVDEIGDVLTLHRDTYEQVPTTLTELCQDVVDGVYKLDDELLLTLDMPRLLLLDNLAPSFLKVAS